MKFLFILLSAMIFLLPQLALANEEDAGSQSHHPQINIVEVKTRLSISPEQEAQFSPLLQQHVKARDALFSKYGLDKEGASISMRNLRSFRKEMLVLSDNTRKQFSDILTESQLKEWDSIQEENRAEIRRGFSL
ncbi:hypothetical protein GCM10009098_11020 [Rheinheimera aquimaris]|uniref:Uncharacterized protein n=1 Tax=Rheinheimera aquimaris TaxID=412437 RepID=A0ABP3NL45_9GAMM|nr:hypothetical protein [Rheinheimera aquimaris]MCB5212943.1 hypothetical protein [Rheinheimera aquimaris]